MDLETYREIKKDVVYVIEEYGGMFLLGVCIGLVLTMSKWGK